jgi:hypothetical protein
LYCRDCGDEIGPSRLLKDAAFCCDAHRQAHSERLSKLPEQAKAIGVPSQSAAAVLAPPSPQDGSPGKPHFKFKLRYTERPARLDPPEAFLPPALPPLAAGPPPLAAIASLAAAPAERLVMPAVSGRLYVQQPEPELPVFAIRLPVLGPARGPADEAWMRLPAAAPVERISVARAMVGPLYAQQAEPELPAFAINLPEPMLVRGPADDAWMPFPAAAPAERISAAHSAAVVAFPGFSALQPVMGSLALADPVSSMVADTRHAIPEPQGAAPVPRTAGPMRTVAVVAPPAHKSVHRGYFPEWPERTASALPDAESARSLATPVSGTVPAAPPLRLPRIGGGPMPSQGLPSAPFVKTAARPAAETAMPTQIPQAPVPTVTLRPPQPLDPIRVANLAVAELMPLEYFCSRGPRAAAHGMGWIIPSIAVTAPRFTAPLSIERVEPLPIAPKEKRKKPAFAEIFALPEAAGRRSTVLRDVSKLIAACLVIGAMLWYGVSYLRSNHDAVIGALSPAAGGRTLSAEDSLVIRGNSAPQSGGFVNRIRSAISNRAETHLSDGFHSGMAAWGAPQNSWAQGWARHAEGYVTPGKLALFRPSLRYADYRLEFFGQIESKSLDWAVRATDDANYYAMKFAADGPGPRAVVSMVHYPVVAGVKGQRVSTPLNIMIHEHTPYHVAVDVHGDRITTSIEGEEVDSFVDGTLARGGVGFFADAGEQARLYWIKVSKNEDWMGRVCAFLSGSGSDTAQLFPPAGTPSPDSGTPMPANQFALVAGFGLMRRNAFSRISDHRRFSSWRS